MQVHGHFILILTVKYFLVLYKLSLLFLRNIRTTAVSMNNNERSVTDQGTVVSAMSTDKVVDSTGYTR